MMTKRTLLALAASFSLAASAHAGGSLGLEEVLTAVAKAPKVVAEIDAELDRLVAERAAAVGSVPDDLMAAYEPLRSSLGGVAVARLLGSRCEGCHLEIPSAELEEVRRAPEDALVHCPECMRILVR